MAMYNGDSGSISVIIPTYNENENLPVLVNSIMEVFRGNIFHWEIIIVDDGSPDGTGDTADHLSSINPNIKAVHRKDKKGLSSAVMEGFRHASGGIIGVMDADLSHPPEVIPDLLRHIIDERSEFVIASRYKKNEYIENWSLSRKIISRVATLLAKPLTKVSDPMSGFFFFRKNIIDGIELSPVGYKIMLEILVKGNYDRDKVMEIPFIFRDRYKGKSKLNWKEHMNYIQHLSKLYVFTIKRCFMPSKKVS